MASSIESRLANAVFYGIIDSGYVDFANMRRKCQALIDGGAAIIQLRAKKETHAERAKMAEEILPLFQNSSAPIFIINDDIELAASLPNVGLHIGQDDLDPFKAREIMGENRVIGLSTHSIEQAKRADSLAQAIDYFAVGPVFATNTKPGRPAVGLNLVRDVAAMRPNLPWFAIGGVNAKTVGNVYTAGAPRIVVVSDVLLVNDTTNAVKKLIAAKA